MVSQFPESRNQFLAPSLGPRNDSAAPMPPERWAEKRSSACKAGVPDEPRLPGVPPFFHRADAAALDRRDLPPLGQPY